MKTTITIILTVLFVQVKGQIIDFSQRDSLLTIRHDTTFTKADDKLFNGIVRTTSEDEVEFSYYKNGFRFVDSSFHSTQKLKAVIRSTRITQQQTDFYSTKLEDTRLTEIDNVFLLRKAKRLPFEKRSVLAEVKAQHRNFPISAEVIGKFTHEIQKFVDATWYNPDEALQRGSLFV